MVSDDETVRQRWCERVRRVAAQHVSEKSGLACAVLARAHVQRSAAMCERQCEWSVARVAVRHCHQS